MSFKVGDIVEIVADPLCDKDCCPNGGIGSKGQVVSIQDYQIQIKWFEGDCADICNLECFWVQSLLYKLKKVMKHNRNGANECM